MSEFTILIGTVLFFNEIPKQSRQIYLQLTESEIQQSKIEQKLKKKLEEYTLSGHSECTHTYYYFEDLSNYLTL